MRAVAFGLLLVIALAGCSGTEPNSPVDPEEAERSDYVVPSLLFLALALLGFALIATFLLLRKRRRRERDDQL